MATGKLRKAEVKDEMTETFKLFSDIFGTLVSFIEYTKIVAKLELTVRFLAS